MILPESFCCQCDIEAMYSNKCKGLPNENDMAQKLNCKSLYSFVNSSKSSKAFNLQFVDISYLAKMYSGSDVCGHQTKLIHYFCCP